MMRPEFKYAFCGFLLVPLIIIVFLVASAGSAVAQDCDIFICKSAEGSGDTEFNFFGTSPLGPLDFTLIGFGEESCEFFSIPLTQSLVVFEDPTPGWQLVDIECVDEVGVNTAFLENGVQIDCVGPNLGSVRCTFFNVRSERAIPTLSQWGMIAAAGGLMLVGVWFAVRKRRARAVNS
jgi:hypothetical protein